MPSSFLKATTYLTSVTLVNGAVAYPLTETLSRGEGLRITWRLSQPTTAGPLMGCSQHRVIVLRLRCLRFLSSFLLPGFEPGCTQVPVGHVVIFWVAESNSSLVTECDQEVALSKPEDNDAWKRLRRVQVAWAHVPILYLEPVPGSARPRLQNLRRHPPSYSLAMNGPYYIRSLDNLRQVLVMYLCGSPCISVCVSLCLWVL